MTTAADPKRARLRDIIAAKSLLTGRQFILASGKPSGFFFDMKKTLLDPEGANLTADLMLDLLEKEDITHVGGLAMGAVPMAAALCVKSFQRGKPLGCFYVRKEAKDHGTESLVDGYLEKGAKVAILEDVTTTGGSATKAVAAVTAQGGKPTIVISVVDRLEGAEDAFRAQGLRLISLFTNDDFR
jgi:orotate phosphoribosyltransferase